ncbi:MAG: flagellin lysine-N-methylase [Clostridiales bacterium]|nr:flagellin lysine-N-methylase [Clostridiales bacterium]
MILRVPDYYGEFSCIADRCKGSCCAGWEIDVDEAMAEYYRGVGGEIGDRLREKLCEDEDGSFRFLLGEDGRCPFLNEKNLCDIYSALGEESLCEVCTDFPRFSLSYGHVMQRVLSISCEEVGRILFTREEPVTFVERTMEGSAEDWEDWDADEDWLSFLERVQDRAISILTDRTKSLEERVETYLSLCKAAQDGINSYSEKSDKKILSDFVKNIEKIDIIPDSRAREWGLGWDDESAYASFDERMRILEGLEELGPRWSETKRKVRAFLTQENYARARRQFQGSGCHDDVAYENLLVYFSFRYLMQAVYSWDLLAHAVMAVTFALMVRDLDVARWLENGKQFTLDDRIATAHIFSREVEHSEENFEQASEELLFVE